MPRTLALVGAGLGIEQALYDLGLALPAAVGAATGGTCLGAKTPSLGLASGSMSGGVGCQPATKISMRGRPLISGGTGSPSA